MLNFKGTLGKTKDWIEHRLPIFSFTKHQAEYQVPKNFNAAWLFGVLSLFMLVVQLVTGLFLAMQYTPHVDYAFDGVERIMRDVHYGWLLRYAHAVGASMFLGVVYIHIARGMYFGSYKSPRELVWIVGVVIFLVMMATAFMGYVLPWGQMSFWGAQVITNMFSAFPIIGEPLVRWIWGDFVVGNATLNRFFVLHFLLPFILIGIVAVHIIALHIHGSGNPSGVEVKSKKDTIPFHPYYTYKDLFGISIFLLLYFYLLFFQPNLLGHPDNYIPADPMKTPLHIVPEWYFLPFYSILRSVDNKLLGVLAMFSAIIFLMFLPWLDRSPVKSGAYRPLFRIFTLIFFLVFLLLGYLGAMPPEEPYTTISRICTTWYFVHLLVVLPVLPKYEKAIQLPPSIDAHYKEMKKAPFWRSYWQSKK